MRKTMFCKKCGREIKSGAKFCSRCGYQFVGNEVSSPPTKTRTVKKKSRVSVFIDLLVMLVIIAVIVVAGILFFKMRIEEPSESSSENSLVQVDDDKENKNQIAIEDDTNEEDDINEEVPKIDDSQVEIEGVEANNIPDYHITTDASDFNTVTFDNNMSFVYPLNFFSKVEQTEHEYIFTTSDGSMTYTIREEDTDQDAISAAMINYNKMDSLLMVEGEDARGGVRMEATKVDDNGWAHSIAGGIYRDDSSKGCYMLTVSNGEKIYTMDVEYTSAYSYYYNPQNYMIDCMYRGFAHSGTSYQIRSYEQFLAEDMGTKR
jgi:hypothetical protein